ncbi:GHKL domain-containing protein [Acidobacteria bacterium AB60]|nr:GHKL domain-containing protein [Acidobacteria bacterium AB60]
MITSSELRAIPAFSDLPEDQIDWFLSHAEEAFLEAGSAFVRQGDPADWMFVFLEGMYQWRGEFGGDTVAIPAQAGEVSGVFPFSRMKQFTVSGVAMTDGRILKFPAARLPELIQKMPGLTTRLVAMMSDRIREGTRIEQQRDRLVSLGKLAAGFAHELNNPASAAKRATTQLAKAVEKMRAANAILWRQSVEETVKTRIEAEEAAVMRSWGTHQEGVALSDLEDALDRTLRDHGFADSWELSAALARAGMQPATLRALLSDLERDTAVPAIARIAAAAEVSVLLGMIESGTSRVSDLIQVVKEYTYLGQAPTQCVDLVASVETTLAALPHLLQAGIEVRRDYAKDPVEVNGAGTELNQVWANLIENAIEAMAGRGQLRLRISREDRFGVVEIGDSGAGIPEAVRPHIFDPFFTTKGVGEGTGLGLSTVQTIVRKHGGHMMVDSRPGDTRFQVWLPLMAAAGSESSEGVER